MKNKLFLVFVIALFAIGITQIQPSQASSGDGYVVIDQVWHDVNMNGIQDEPGIGEVGGLYNIAGMKVNLYVCDSTTALASRNTNPQGKASFSGLAEGNYYVKFFLDPGFTDYVFSPRLQGGNTELDSDPYPDGTTDCFFVPSHPGGTKFVDAGIYKPVQPLTASKTAAGSYDRTVTWTLQKSVSPASHTGKAGETVGSSTWTVGATKSETVGSYQVSGTITVTNQNNFPVEFLVTDTLNDGTVASVTCPNNTVGANSSLECSYTALPADSSATVNTAVVTSLTDGVTGATASASVTFTENLIGYDTGTLSDPRFGYSQEIAQSTTVTFPETFACPEDSGQYVNNAFQFTEENTAYLNGNIGLEASASVAVTCTKQAKGETAWAEGIVYPGHQWFMYTPYSGKAQTVNLLAGQYHVAGTVHFSAPSSKMVTITITLAQGWTFEDVAESVKIQDYRRAPTESPSPGLFAHKGDATGTTFSIVVPQNNFYGVHANVLDWR